MSKQHKQSVRRDASQKRKDGSDHRHDWATLAQGARQYRCGTCGLRAHRTSQHPVYWRKGDAGEDGQA